MRVWTYKVAAFTGFFYALYYLNNYLFLCAYVSIRYAKKIPPLSTITQDRINSKSIGLNDTSRLKYADRPKNPTQNPVKAPDSGTQNKMNNGILRVFSLYNV